MKFLFLQAQVREVTLQEENEAHLKAISNCEKKIQEKLQEADFLQKKLKVRALLSGFIYYTVYCYV